MPTYEVEATDLVEVRRIYHVEATDEADARRKASVNEGLIFVDEELDQAVQARTVTKVTEIDSDGLPVGPRSGA